MHYKPEELVGKTVAAIVNLPPRKMMGLESCGMLLSAVRMVNGKEELHLVMLDDSIPHRQRALLNQKGSIIRWSLFSEEERIRGFDASMRCQ